MKKIIIGGLIAGLVIIIVGMVFGALSADMYKMSPKELWKPMGGDWFPKIIAYDICSAFVLAWIYSIVKNAIPGANLVKGATYGGLMFIVGPMLGLIMTYLTMAIRSKLIVFWALNSLVNYVLSGIIFDLVDRKIS
jgi:hypothetical protein